MDPNTRPMTDQDRYADRSIFRSDRPVEDKPVRMFEERVVLLRASRSEEALAKGRAEAQRYADSETHPTMLNHIVAFAIWEVELKEGK